MRDWVASNRVIAVAFAASVSLMLYVQLGLIPEFKALTGGALLDFGGYDRGSIDERIASFGREGLKLYDWIRVVDFMMPLAIGVFLFGLCARLSRGHWTHRFSFAPLSLTALDYAENVLIYAMLKRSSGGGVPGALVDATLAVTKAKEAAYAGAVVWTVASAAWWIVRRRRALSEARPS